MYKKTRNNENGQLSALLTQI